MLTDISIALQEAISKNLSAEIGNHLQARLKKAESDAKKVEELTASVERLQSELSKHESLSHRQHEYQAAVEKLAKDREALETEKRTHEHRLEIHKIKQECAEKTLNRIEGIVETVFRAPMTKEIITNYKAVPIMSNPSPGCGSPYQVGTATETRTDTKTVEVGGAPDPNQPR